jgi:hypothetical protein
MIETSIRSDILLRRLKLRGQMIAERHLAFAKSNRAQRGPNWHSAASLWPETQGD